LTKDEQIRLLTEKYNTEKAAWRVESDEFKLTIHNLEILVQENKSRVVSLEEIIYKKKDVEA
jgi:hypothetical protein